MKENQPLCQIHFFRYCKLENKFPLNLNILTEHRFIFFHWILKFCKKLNEVLVGTLPTRHQARQLPLFVVEKNFSNRTLRARPGPVREMFSISHTLTSHQKLKGFISIQQYNRYFGGDFLCVTNSCLSLVLFSVCLLKINAVLGMSGLWWSSGGRQ